MAKEIDQLNYKVILDDKEFDARIKADLQLAKDFNIQMSQLLDIKNKASSADVKAATNAERIAREQLKTQQMLAREQSKTAAAQVKAQEQMRREQQKTSSQAVINSEKEQRAMTQTLTAQERLNKMKQAGNTHYGTQNRLLRELAGYGAAYFSVRTVERFISSLVRVSGEFELQHRTLQAIVGDIDAADKIFNQLQVLAVKSPFSFSQLTSYTKQLSAFSVPTEELYETTKMLADVSAGLGVDMGRIILAYGQIRSAAFLRGQEVRQLTEAGIPILTELAKQFTEIEGRMISAGEVFDKISMREVPFAMVEKVFKDMTSEGGKFYNMQEIQAETLKAKVKNLGDQYDIMLYQIGQAQDGLLKGSVTAIGKLMEHWQRIGRVIVSVASGFGAYAAVLATVAVRKKALLALDTIKTINNLSQRVGSLTKAISIYTRAMQQAGKATQAAFAASIVGIIAAVAVEIIQLVRSAGELNRELNKIANTKFSESSDTIRGLDTLVKKLEAATEGSQNYRDAIHELNRRYGDYLPNLVTERDTLDEIRLAADAAAESIRNKAQASALAEGKEKIGERYGKKLNKKQSAIIDDIQRLIPSTTTKDATNIFNLFKDILDSEEIGPYTALRRAINTYVNPGEAFWTRLTQTNDPLWLNTRIYAETMQKWDKEIEKYNEKLGIVFSDYTPQSKHEQETLSAIDAYYTKQEQAIRRMQASEEEVNKMLKDLKIQRLENEILFYSGQGITLGDKEIADGVLREEIAKKKRAELAKLTAKPTKGARLVQEALAGQGITERNRAWGLWADETTDFSADGYYKTLDEQYKEIEPNIQRARERFLSIAGLPFERADISKLDAEAQSAYNDIVSYNKRKEAIIAIAEKLGYSLGDATVKKGGSGEDPRLKALKLRQQHIEEIRKQYEAFKPFMNKSDDTTIRGILFNEETGLFPKETDEALKSTLDFDAALLRVADDMEKYGEKGAEAARKIREEVELHAAKVKAEGLLQSYKDSATALEKVQGILDKIAENIKDVNGESLQLKVNVIRDELDRKNRKAEAEATEQRNTILAGEQEYKELHRTEGDVEALWATYRDNALAAVDAWVKAEKQANRDIAQGRISELGGSFVKGWMRDKHGLTIERLDKKNIKELTNILNALRGLTDEEIMSLIPDEDKEKAEALNLTIDDIVAKIRQARDVQDDAISEQRWEKIKKQILDTGISTFVKGLSTAADLMRQIADASDDIRLADAAAMLQSFAQNLSSAYEGFKSGGWIGAIVGGVSDWLQQGVSAYAQAKIAEAEYALSHEQFIHRLNMANLSLDDSLYDTIFGTTGITKGIDGWRKAQSAMEQYMAAVGKQYEMTIEDIANRERKDQKMLGGFGGLIFSGGWTAFSSGPWTDKRTSLYKQQADALARGLTELQAMSIKVKSRNGFQKFWGAEDQYKSLYDIAPQLWDENGDFNVEAAKEFLETEKRITDAQRTQIQNVIELKEAYDDAMAAIDDHIESVFGSLGEDMSDAIWDFVVNGGEDAWDRFREIGSESIAELGKQMLKEMIITDYLAQYKEKFREAYKSGTPEEVAANVAAITAEMMNGAEANIGVWSAAVQGFSDSVAQMGYDVSSASSDTSVVNGLKSLTEDTGNLLASYVNALRADVSAMRISQNTGWLDVKLIAARMPSPTVWEHIQQIAVHTSAVAERGAEIAESNAAILAEMRSIITSEDGAAAVRTTAI